MAEKRLYRARTDRVVAGVCGGVAHYLNVDPVVVRVVWAVATVVFFLGPGIIAYLVAWFIIPEEPLAASEPPAAGRESEWSGPGDAKSETE